MSSQSISKRPDQISFTGLILFLTEDTSLIRRQLEAGAEAVALEQELAERLANNELP